MAGMASGGKDAGRWPARRRRRRAIAAGAGGGELLVLPLDGAGHVLEIALEHGDARGEPLAVGGEFAQLRGEALGLGLGLRPGAAESARPRCAGSLA